MSDLFRPAARQGLLSFAFMESATTLSKAISHLSTHLYHRCWQLKSENGRQWWECLLPEEALHEETIRQISEAFIYTPPHSHSADGIYRSVVLDERFKPLSDEQFPLLPTEKESGQKIFRPLYRAMHYFAALQADDGHFPGDYGGPLFLTPGLVIISYVTQTPLSPLQQALVQRYMLNHQNEDGGWGLHIEGKSTMFGTVMQYVALRILGMSPEDHVMQRARHWIWQHGGATAIPSWGKFYLSVLGCYEWEGCNSLLPEMWLMPRWLPVHPSRFWCHARMVYLPMSYCYGHRVTGAITPLVNALRTELYNEPYEKINWKKARNQCADTDLYYPPSKLLHILHAIANSYEKVVVNHWRKKALDFILEYIHAEDTQTHYVNIGPVNQVINSLCVWHAWGKESEAFQRHVERWKDYLWLAEDGMKMNGYNGSQLWDTAFALQAMTEAGMEKFFPNAAQKAYRYLDISQIQTETACREKFFRHMQVGGWPFSTRDHSWPITDCTAEGLKAVLKLHSSSAPLLLSPRITDERLKAAVDIILSFQNPNGSWATYELTRGPRWLELLNPSQVFGNIMIDYGYTECTSACVQALLCVQTHFPTYRKAEIKTAIHNGIRFIRSQQRPDGSWYGSWGICFTYGTWFGVEALSFYLQSHPDPAIISALSQAAAFLLSKQLPDGGWGESYRSCITKEYISQKQSQVINTAWALLSLMAIRRACCYDTVGKCFADNFSLPISSVNDAIERGIQLLLARQQANGDWPQESIIGVFNHNCMITYSNYRNIFPIWALARYLNTQ